MAEHIAMNEFVVRDATVHKRGTLASFLRTIEEALAGITRFFDKTRHEYTRFNYIGEWHSHPRFEPLPSLTDHESMRRIACDSTMGTNFVVLLILKLDVSGSLIGSVHTYAPDGSIERSQLSILVEA